MRQKCVFLCILCLLCGIQTNGVAQSRPYTQQVTQPLTLNGQEGVWLPKDKAIKLLTDVSLLAPTRQALTAQKDLVNALNNKIRVVMALQDAWKDIALHQPKKAWWENSSVLMCAGFVTGALLVVGLTALVQQGSL